MSDATTPAPASRPRHGPIFCMRCGYNLAGLPDSGTCPECSLSIAQSTNTPLAVAPKVYRNTVRRGLIFLAFSTTIASVISFLKSTSSIYYSLQGGIPPEQEGAYEVFFVLSCWSGLIALLGLGLGSLWVTQAPPLLVQTHVSVAACRWARLLSVLTMLFWAIESLPVLYSWILGQSMSVVWVNSNVWPIFKTMALCTTIPWTISLVLVLRGLSLAAGSLKQSRAVVRNGIVIICLLTASYIFLNELPFLLRDVDAESYKRNMFWRAFLPAGPNLILPVAGTIAVLTMGKVLGAVRQTARK